MSNLFIKKVITYKDKLLKSSNLSNFTNILNHKAALVFSFTLLICSCIYVATAASLAQLSTADQFNSTYATSGVPDGAVVLLKQHTNLIKLPVLAVQGKLPYNMASFVGLNILFVTATCVGWMIFIYKITRSKGCLVLGNLLLCGLLVGSIDLSIGLTMTTQRNIEYPLVFGYLLIISNKLITFSRVWWLFGVLILGALISSDYFFLYTVPVAVGLCITLLYLYKKVSLKQFLIVFSNVICGVVFSYVLLRAFVKLHLISLLDMRGHHVFVSYDEFWLQVQIMLHQALKLFGGDFFGKPATIGALFILPFTGFFLLSIILLRKNLKFFSEHLKFGLIQPYMGVFALIVCLMYILSGQATFGDANIRYLTVLPFIGVFITSIYASSGKKGLKIFSLIAVLILFSGILKIHRNQILYDSKRIETNEFIELDKRIINNLVMNDVDTAFGTIGYSATTWFVSHKTIDAYNILPCNKTRSALTNAAWFRKDVLEKRTALIIDRGYPSYAEGESWHDCSGDTLEKIYGKPASISRVGEHLGKPVEVWVFDYDIRTNMVTN